MSICNQGKLKCQIRFFSSAMGLLRVLRSYPPCWQISSSSVRIPAACCCCMACGLEVFVLLLLKIAWTCMYIEYSDKTKLLVFGLQMINRDSSPLNTLLKKLAFQQIFQQMLTLNYDRRQFTSLWQPWFFTLHGTSVVDNGNRLCKDTTWLGRIGIPVPIFGLPFHGITTPNRPTGSYNSQSMVGISS